MNQNKNVMEFFVRRIIRILETIFCHENIFYYVKTKVKRVHFKFLSLSFKIELHNVVSCFAFVLCFADLFSCSQTYKKKVKRMLQKLIQLGLLSRELPRIFHLRVLQTDTRSHQQKMVTIQKTRINSDYHKQMFDFRIYLVKGDFSINFCILIEVKILLRKKCIY